MQPTDRVKVGHGDLEVTALSFGAAPIGNFVREMSEEDAGALVARAWDVGLRYFDTAPYYGHGLSELRTGQGLRWKNRDDYVVSSKVGRLLKPAPRGAIDFTPWANAGAFRCAFDYSYDGTMRSIEDSLQRLALERIDIAFIHDCDHFTHGDRAEEMFEAAMKGAAPALLKLRDEGVVKAVGLGINEWQLCEESLKRHDLDCFLLAGRYTLLEQESLDGFMPLCEARNASVVIGGGFNSGILAKGTIEGARYNYAPAPPEVMDKAARIEAVCRVHQVPLGAAAMQFVMAHPAVSSFIAGVRTVAQLDQNVEWFSHPIPGEIVDGTEGARPGAGGCADAVRRLRASRCRT